MRKQRDYKYDQWRIVFVDRHGCQSVTRIFADTKARALDAVRLEAKEILTITREKTWVRRQQ